MCILRHRIQFPMIGKNVVMDVRLVHLVQLPAVCRYRRTVLLRQKCGGENDACEKTETQGVFDKSSDHVPSRLSYSLLYHVAGYCIIFDAHQLKNF